jgi:hypothetical protein
MSACTRNGSSRNLRKLVRTFAFYLAFNHILAHPPSFIAFHLDEEKDIFVIKEKWGKGDTVPDTQIFKLDFTKSARYHKRKIQIKSKNSSRAWQNDASTNPGSPPALTAASTINFGQLTTASSINMGHLSPRSTVPRKKLPLSGIEEAESEEKWGEGDFVPDTQIFILDFTKSSRYRRRKITLKRKASSSAWVPSNGGSPKAFTAASTMNIFEKAASTEPRADQDDSAEQSGEIATLRDEHVETAPDQQFEAKNPDELPIKRIPTTTLPALRTSTNAGSPKPLKAASTMKISDLSSRRAVSVKKLEVENAPNFTVPAQDSSSAVVPDEDDGAAQFREIATFAEQHLETAREQHLEAMHQDKPKTKRVWNAHLPDTRTSLMEEGLDYDNHDRESHQGHLVGTVHSDGTVETKRRWFCCGRRALDPEVQRAIAAITPKKEKGIDEALTSTIRDRVRRSQRNARFHRYVVSVFLLCTLARCSLEKKVLHSNVQTIGPAA